MTELESLLPQTKDRVRFERLLQIIKERKGHRLAAEVESAKIELSNCDRVRVMLPVNDQVEVTISQAESDAVVVPKARAIAAAVEECCVQAMVDPRQIDTVFLTGGTSMIPEVRSHILKYLPGVRMVDGDVFGSVGLGLGIDAARRFEG